MTPFVINYYGRLGRRRLHFVNLIMPAATQWLDPFPWSMDSPLLYYVRKEMKANWMSLVANVVDYVLLMLFWRVFGKPRLHRTVYLMSLCAWTGVLASRGSEAVLQLFLYVASRKKVVSLYSYVCWTNIHIRYDVCDWFRTFLVSLGSDKLVHSPVPLSSTHFSMFSHATKA